MAGVRHQNQNQRVDFESGIAVKESEAREAQEDRINSSMPGWVAFFIRPLAVSARNRRQRGFQKQGRGGENMLTAALRWRLDERFTLCPDFVIQVGAGKNAQLDLLVVGASSLFVIEVKTWKGAIRATGLQWERRVGNRWKTISSPARQQQMHVRRFVAWLEQNGLAVEKDAIYAAIVMMDAEWLRTRDVPFAVFDRPSAAARWMKKLDGDRDPLDPAVRERLLTLLCGDETAAAP